jgi:probable rRNA maturation factor
LFNVRTRMELFRIIIHGILHLTGYSDKTKMEKSEMTAAEDYYFKKYYNKGSVNH